MLTPGPKVSPQERRLLRLFRALDERDRETLLRFADFLAQSGQDASSVPASPLAEPEPLPRPAEETVIAAIRRLSQTYRMLDRGPILSQTSTLMSAHLLQGRAAHEVIDELETLFAEHYRISRDAAPNPED
jgi:hypothetical protein